MSASFPFTFYVLNNTHMTGKTNLNIAMEAIMLEGIVIIMVYLAILRELKTESMSL